MISSVAAMVTGQLHEHNINKNKLFDPQKQYDQWFQNLVLVIYSFGTYGMPLIDSYKIFWLSTPYLLIDGFRLFWTNIHPCTVIHSEPHACKCVIS